MRQGPPSAEARINALAVVGALALGFGALAVYGAFRTYEGWVNRGGPLRVTVDEIAQSPNARRSYVSVRGEFYPVVFRFGEGEKGRVKLVERAWAPLVDPQHQRGLFVEVADPQKTRTDEVPRVQPVTGMLRPMNAPLRVRMQELGGKLGPVVFDSGRVLAQGQHPGNPLRWGAFTLVSALLAVALPLLLWRRLSPPGDHSRLAHEPPDPALQPTRR